jgi:IclR family transcriptional regulator, pca regulon regulatory protein
VSSVTTSNLHKEPGLRKEPGPNYRIEALAKGLRLLNQFTEQRPKWRVTELATATKIPVPTVFRVVMTLVQEGYLEALPTGEYRPGVATLTLGTAALRSLDLVTIASPLLHRLADATGETVNLAVLMDDRILYLVRIRNADLVTANIQVGSTLPATTTSIGKLLLAYLDPAERDKRLSASSIPAQRGPNAKATLGELRDEFAAIRMSGWALQDEELAGGLRSLAGPIRSRSGRVVAGVNLVVQAGECTTERLFADFQQPLLDTCASISSLIHDDVL